MQALFSLSTLFPSTVLPLRITVFLFPPFVAQQWSLLARNTHTLSGIHSLFSCSLVLFLSFF
jgi:hypothetical protein